MRKLAEAYHQVFSSGDGKLVLADLMSRFHVLGPSFAGDPYTTAFREGERNVLLYIAEKLALDPARFAELYSDVRDEILRWSND